MELRRKEYERKVMCMRIMAAMNEGQPDEEILKKYITMSMESQPFSVGAWGPGELKDDTLSGDKLIELGFVNDGTCYSKLNMSWDAAGGDVAYNGKVIVNGVYGMGQFAGLLYQITGTKLL